MTTIESRQNQEFLPNLLLSCLSSDRRCRNSGQAAAPSAPPIVPPPFRPPTRDFCQHANFSYCQFYYSRHLANFIGKLKPSVNYIMQFVIQLGRSARQPAVTRHLGSSAPRRPWLDLLDCTPLDGGRGADGGQGRTKGQRCHSGWWTALTPCHALLTDGRPTRKYTP